jgi:hypothetical protein
MYNLNPNLLTHGLTTSQLNVCMAYRDALQDFHMGISSQPGIEPIAYQWYLSLIHTTTDRTQSAQSQARFTAAADGTILDLANNTIRALLVTQDKLCEALKLASWATGEHRARFELGIPRVPQGFIGVVNMSLVLRICMQKPTVISIIQQIEGTYLQDHLLRLAALERPALTRELVTPRSNGRGRIHTQSQRCGGKGEGNGQSKHHP